MTGPTVLVAALVFALVGTLVIAAVLPHLTADIDAKPIMKEKLCSEHSPNGGVSGPPCGPTQGEKIKVPLFFYLGLVQE